MMERFLKGEWGRGLLLEYVRLLVDADELHFVPCSDLFSDTFDMFTHQPNTRLSFADAAIAHVAQRRADGLVLTFDGEPGRFPGIRVPS
jgi:hypothetical protein